MHPIPTPRPDSEFARMLAGELYLASDPELVDLRRRARRLTRLFNQTTEEQHAERAALLHELFGTLGPGAEIEPTFRCDYGFNIRAGARLFMNFGCVVLDCAPVTIGRACLFGPGVHIYAATHPTDAVARQTGRELAKPVTIGDDVWVGGGAIICPGVTIGDGAVIGAGSIVTRSVAAGVVVVGNPARAVNKPA
ncbi:MAG: sugar O-acetyltransferase [Phycisphaerales bacterium]|nr:sugar O-acetyltransferase [Phycisphaerales bacterium]